MDEPDVEKDRLKNLAAADQAAARLANDLPAMLWGFYSEAISQGFSENAALALTVELLKSVTGIRRGS